MLAMDQQDDNVFVDKDMGRPLHQSGLDHAGSVVPEDDSPVRDDPRKPGRKPCPQKRLRILEAAVELYSARDYHKVHMEHIADKAGVGKGTIYRYFPTKEALFLQLVHVAVDRVGEVIKTCEEHDESALDKLRRAVTLTLEYFRLHEPFISILSHEKVYRECQEKAELERKRLELRTFFSRLLAEGMAEGAVRRDLEPDLAALVLTSAMRSLLRNFGSQRTSEHLAEQLLSIVLDGVVHDQERVRRKARPRSLRDVTGMDQASRERLNPLKTLANLAEPPHQAGMILNLQAPAGDEAASEGEASANVESA
jgi:AcrR family transcriptional regulator